MPDHTPNLDLPYVAAAQAQKHVTHNEAIRTLDAIVQIGVVSRSLTAPPPTPVDGARYIIPAGSTGLWAAKSGKLAAWQDGAWAYLTPRDGWLAWVAAEAQLLVFTAGAWIIYTSGLSSVNPIALVGVNATADATNKLAVASQAALFNHDGAGHQLKINKAASTNSASLLFQTNFSGRAEYGLTGDDNFHVKVSPDGSTWREAMIVDRSSGIASMRAIDSVQLVLPTDTVQTVTTPSAGGLIAISHAHPTNPNAAVAGILSYDTGVSPALVTLSISTGITNGGLAVLTGTYGTVGRVTVAANASGQLMIENRLTSTAQICLTFIGGYRAPA